MDAGTELVLPGGIDRGVIGTLVLVHAQPKQPRSLETLNGSQRVALVYVLRQLRCHSTSVRAWAVTCVGRGGRGLASGSRPVREQLLVASMTIGPGDSLDGGRGWRAARM